MPDHVADVVEGRPPRKAGSFPITVDASGTPDGLRCALHSTAFDGTCTSRSVYLDDPALPMFSMYSRCCTLHTGRAHVRPAIPHVLDLVTAGLDASLVTPAVVARTDARRRARAPADEARDRLPGTLIRSSARPRRSTDGAATARVCRSAGLARRRAHRRARAAGRG